MKRIFCFAALALVAGCNDVSAPDRDVTAGPGRALIRTLTTGGDIDLNGYRIVVDSAINLDLGTNTVTRVDGLDAGRHVVEIQDVAANCVLDGPSSREFTVVSGEAVDVTFKVECSTTGVEVITRAAGVDQPINGLSATVAGIAMQVPAHGSTTVSRLTPGSHPVTLLPTENCSVLGEATRVVTVENRRVIPVTFEVECSATEKDIVFASDTVSGGQLWSRVIAATRSGTSLVALAENGSGPAWSPDGKDLVYSNAYCDFYYGEPCGGGLVVIDVATRLVKHVRQIPGIDPAWSPDGKSIAFVTISRPRTALVVARSDLDSVVVLDPPVFNVGNPTWSPDGNRIAFNCQAGVGGDHMCVVNKDGSGFLQLTAATGWSGMPAWSPDGTTIAFVTTRFNGASDIALMAADGSNVRRVTGGEDPAWSPDGSKILFAGSNGLFTINPDGSGLTRLTTGRHRQPAWRP